ncbi:MAG: isocitrate lyase/phosphoenolpyruvate mutase family protein, partial [Alphaproteobacteria bacterium]|nr:isocitrate lyase/phosphoenolpyruvate mutase family protein [Alphaproteobacteria bacterium]
MTTAGQKFRDAITQEKPLQIPGAINAYTAMMAAQAGYKALYLSGGGVAYASNGLPDLGITDLHDVLEEARKITAAVDVPLLIDIDTGWGGAFNIGRTIKESIRAGVAAVHIEDQVAAKRCGHRPGKELVTREEMGDRVKAAVDAKTDASFVVMARSDALAGEGLDGVIERALYYVECGADAIFAEAMTDLSHYQKIKDAVKVPLLAN